MPLRHGLIVRCLVPLLTLGMLAVAPVHADPTAEQQYWLEVLNRARLDPAGELERLVHTLPPGPNQRDRGPNQYLLKLLAIQTERAELVPLVDALHARLHAEKAMDFGMQMSTAAQLAQRFPQVGAALRERYRVVLLDEYQDTGHAQRIALSALFGGGADDGLALTAVGDPIQSIYGWQGKIEESVEVTCLIKTTRARQPALFARLAALHPYEVPELVAIPTLAVNPAYLAWAAALCRAEPAEAAGPTAPDEEASAH